MAKSNPVFSSLLEKTGLSPQDASEQLEVSLRTIYRWMNEECQPNALALKQLKSLSDLSREANDKRQANFKFIDLFAGIGGFRKAFDSIGGQCVFTSEWDKNCRVTYQANYDCQHDVVGDIREFTKDEESLSKIPKHDVLVAGFPCQPFSIAGVSKKNALGRDHGFRCDTQGTLFFDLAQIIEHHKPSVFLLENVKNLTSHDKGNTFKVIKRTLTEELGYHIEFKVIDARNWVPQHRERIFIVGFKRDLGFRFSDLKIPEQSPTLATILHSYEEEDEAPYFLDGHVGDKYTLTPKLWDYLIKYKEKHRAKGNGFGYSCFDETGVARTLSARYYKDGSEILIAQEDNRPRRLTPRECARLMGFDNFRESGFYIPVSDTQAYRQFGNSVVVPLAKAIASLISPFIDKAIATDENQLPLPLELPDNLIVNA